MSAWGWHWHCPKCHQTITDLNKDAHLGTCSAPRSPSSSKPVNCPECGRFEGHVVTCTSWRPVRCNPADIMARRAGEGVAATPPTAGRQQFVRCPKMGVACTVGCPPGGCVIKDSWLQSGPIDPYTPASSGPQVVDSSAWTGRDETMTTGHNKEQTMTSTRADLIQRCNRTTIGAGDICAAIKQMTNDGTEIDRLRATVESLAAENSLRDGVLTDANRRFEERRNADLEKIAELSAKLGETGGRRGWAVQPQIDDLDARITALVERISRFEGRINDQGRRLDCLAHGTHTALVKRIEAVERQLPAGGRGGLSDQAQCSDGTTSIKPPPPLSQQELRRKYGLREGTQEQADIAAAARKATLKDVALLLRTMMRNKSEGGLNLDATDCVLLTAALDDYFGDKAGKDTP